MQAASRADYAAPAETIRASRLPPERLASYREMRMADTEREGTLREIAERLDELRRYL